jgi:hypothetical protein
VLGWTSQEHVEEIQQQPEVTEDLSLDKERSDLGQLIPRLRQVSAFLTEKFIHQVSVLLFLHA